MFPTPTPRTLARFAATLGAAFALAAGAGPKEELKELRGRIEAMQQRLQAAEESKSEAVDALRESERAISDAKRALRELNDEQRAINGRLLELKADRRKLEGDVAASQTKVTRLIYRQYLAGQPDALKLLLNREDPERLARQLHYLTYLSRAHAELIRRLRADLASLAGVADETRQKLADLARLEQQQQRERSRLERENRDRKEVLAKLSRRIDSQRREITTSKRNETRLTRLLEQLGKALAQPRSPRPGSVERNERVPDASDDGKPFATMKGRLALPVRGELRSHFGSPRAEGGLSWKGLFIAAGAGQEVKAIASGRVVYADWLRGFGNLLILDHGGGYMSLYGNNETLYKQAGQAARGGEAVAAVGASGGNPDSGLYFELRYQGKPFDPLTWVQLK